MQMWQTRPRDLVRSNVCDPGEGGRVLHASYGARVLRIPAVVGAGEGGGEGGLPSWQPPVDLACMVGERRNVGSSPHESSKGSIAFYACS